jgi:hypothetical protein
MFSSPHGLHDGKPQESFGLHSLRVGIRRRCLARTPNVRSFDRKAGPELETDCHRDSERAPAAILPRIRLGARHRSHSLDSWQVSTVRTVMKPRSTHVYHFACDIVDHHRLPGGGMNVPRCRLARKVTSPSGMPAAGDARLPDSYVPPVVAILESLARGGDDFERAAKASGTSAERALERCVHAAFTILGYETKLLGQCARPATASGPTTARSANTS